MSREAAVRAYRDSVFDAAEINVRRRIGARSIPIVGGLLPALGLIANGLWRPIKVVGALLFGYGGSGERNFPTMPEIPAAFQNSDLGKSFGESWKLQEESAKARVESFGRLLSLDISGWWQEASVAAHAQAKDQAVIFPEEQAARNAGQSAVTGGFVGALLASRDGLGSDKTR